MRSRQVLQRPPWLFPAARFATDALSDAVAVPRRPNPHLHRADLVVTAVLPAVRLTVVRCSKLAEDAQVSPVH